MKRRVCKDCLAQYRRSREGRAAKIGGGAWGHGNWPAHVYHDGSGRCCEAHAVARRVDGGKRRELQQCPAWADSSAIRAVYREADRLTRETGIPHEVDHEIPLRGRLVSGLHVHTNLRPLPARENRRKSNAFHVQ